MSIKVERLVNLTIALLESRKPLSYAEIRARTGYYDQGDPESARRMFERDKDELRGLGVPVQVVEDPLGGEAGYLVDRRTYEMPDVDLDRDEVAALGMALRLAGSSEDRLALSRLAARSPDPLAVAEEPTTRMRLQTARLDELADALVLRRVVTFEYRTGQGATARRTVDPYTVALRTGSWYLLGRDHDRDDVRAFRLDRVVGPIEVTETTSASDTPADLDVAAHVSGPQGERVDLDVRVSEPARWAVEARGGRLTSAATNTGHSHYTIPDVDPARILPWLLNLGPDVIIVEPPELRDAVMQRLREQVAAL